MKYFIIDGCSFQPKERIMNMEDLRVFENKEFGSVRIVTISNEPWFAGKDVAVALGYAKPTDAVRKRVDEEDRGISKMETPSGTQEMTVINESGLYALIFGSKLESAKKFKRWVTAEVLPALRKTGSYEMTKEQKKADRTEIMLMNARSRMAQTYLKLAQVDTLSTTYKTILTAKAAETLAGEALLPLPKSERKVYSAGEIGAKFGITANMVGRIANKHGLKTEKYGEYRRSKSEHSAKEIDTWVYFDTVLPVIEGILNQEVA